MFDNLSYEPFKEPRGFLKLLQWLMAIFAFATTVNFTTDPKVVLTCRSGNETGTVGHTIEYPFALDHDLFSINLRCVNTPNDTKYECGPIGNAKSDSQFFVTSGVLAFLYSTIMIGIFLFADKIYTENPRSVVWDFIITLIFAVFFLSGSSAWAHGLSAVRSGSDPNNWELLEVNKSGDIKFRFQLCGKDSPFTCAGLVEGEFGGLVISILFGFICFILWSGNLWFLYKETPWFGGGMENTQSSNMAGGV